MRPFFDDERSILEEFYSIKKEYNAMDKRNPDHTARRDELRARYRELDEQYGTLFQKRVEQFSALMTAQESGEVISFESPGPSTLGPMDSDGPEESASLDKAAGEETIVGTAEGVEIGAFPDAIFDDEEDATDEVIVVSTASAETGPVPENMMLVPIERDLVPVGTDDTLPISSGILELAHTVSCPYCAEQIKPDARKCHHCDEWLKRSDDNSRFNFDAIKHPQLKDVQVKGSIGVLWKTSGVLLGALGAGGIAVLQFGTGLPYLEPYAPEALLSFLTTGYNGAILGGVVCLLGLSSLGIGKLLSVPRRSPLPIHELARLGCIEELILAFSAGKDISETDAQGCTSLHAAVLGRQHATVSYLVSVGANVEARTRKGETPLQLAVMNEDTDMIDYFVKHGANIHVTNHRGSTLLQVSAWLGNNDLVRRFRDLGLDANATGKSGYTPLHFAAQGGHVETVRYLLVMGADPNAVSAKGHTPMYAAAKNGHVAVCRLLVNAGASTEPGEDKAVPSPLKIARDNKRVEVVTFLEEAGIEA
jgi:Ankyrin repeats (3 copies)/Ankyrin repeat